MTRKNRETPANAAADGDKTLAKAWSRVPASTGASGLPNHSQLLASVAEFTYHRDIETLDHSLVLTLAELTSAYSISLGKRGGGGGRFTLDSIVQCMPDKDGNYVVAIIDAPGPDHPATARLLKSMEEMERYAQIDVKGIYLLTVPILCEGRAIAALHVASGLLPISSRPLLEGFARIYANYTALLHESERDELTGLYNRRTFDRHLQRMLQPTDTPLVTKLNTERRHLSTSAIQVWLAILDIDHFKRINDSYGHIYGDEVILLLAQQMNASFRRDDKLFRFGGEEFVILLRMNDEPTLQMVLERFRRRIAEHVFPQVEHVTVSIGYARIGEHDYPRTVLDRADKALYFAKKNGRNRIGGYESLVAEGRLDQATTAGTIDLF